MKRALWILIVGGVAAISGDNAVLGARLGDLGHAQVYISDPGCTEHVRGQFCECDHGLGVDRRCETTAVRGPEYATSVESSACGGALGKVLFQYGGLAPSHV